MIDIAGVSFFLCYATFSPNSNVELQVCFFFSSVMQTDFHWAPVTFFLYLSFYINVFGNKCEVSRRPLSQSEIPIDGLRVIVPVTVGGCGQSWCITKFPLIINMLSSSLLALRYRRRSSLICIKVRHDSDWISLWNSNYRRAKFKPTNMFFCFFFKYYFYLGPPPHRKQSHRGNGGKTAARLTLERVVTSRVSNRLCCTNQVSSWWMHTSLIDWLI